MRKKKSEKLDPLEEIKRLLILGLVNQGVKGKDIAAMLEIDPAMISRLLSRNNKKVKNELETET
jgi:DNA-directed RNA polymerase specialized sigma subunit